MSSTYSENDRIDLAVPSRSDCKWTVNVEMEVEWSLLNTSVENDKKRNLWLGVIEISINGFNAENVKDLSMWSAFSGKYRLFYKNVSRSNYTA